MSIANDQYGLFHEGGGIMDGVREYIVSVVTAALICGILSCLIQNTGGKELMKLLCGLFLTITVMRPVADLDFNALSSYTISYRLEGEHMAAQGENLARETMAGIIKNKSETYILDKAAEWRADVSVEVVVSEDLVPVSARLSGKISPYLKQRLENTLESDLGIAKENQIWTG